MTAKNFSLYLVLAILSLPACSTFQANSGASIDHPNPAQSTGQVRTENSTVEHFVTTAREQFRNNKLNKSAETINRGLNIAPENPVLWHLLAKIRFLQDQYDECETLASRSLNYTNDNRQLANQNWRLIAHARDRMDNPDGAQQALENIEGPETDTGWLWW